MSLDMWLLFVAVSLLPAISPGPAILLAISNALRFGATATIASAIGNATGLLILGYAVTLGLGALMAASALVFTIIKMTGAIYLVYLGVKLFRDKAALAPSQNADAPRQSYRQLFTTGLIVSISNPKAIFIIAAMFPQFLSSSSNDLTAISILSITYAVMCFLNHALLALFGGKVRKMLKSATVMTRIRKSLGIAFVGFGAALAAVSR